MGVKIKAMSDSRAQMHANGKCTQVTSSSEETFGISASVESNSIFMQRRDDAILGVDYQDRYHRKGLIQIPLPVINPMVVGKDYTKLRKIFSHVNEIDGILNFELIYDLKEKKYIKVFGQGKVDVEWDNERYIVGAEIIRKLIEELDIENLILDTLIKPRYVTIDGEQKKKNPSMIETLLNEMGLDCGIKGVSVTKGSGNFIIIDDYYLNFVEGIPDGITQEVVTKAFCDRFAYHVSDSNIENFTNHKLAYLIRFKNNPDLLENLRNCVISNIVVLPKGYRPRTDKMKHHLTMFYDSLIKSSDSLRSSLNSHKQRASDVVSKYRSMVNRYIGLTIKVQNTNPAKTNKTKSIAETLEGKEGRIRANLLNSVIDYAGRTVIISDPSLKINEVGVPRAMFQKVAELEIARVYKGNARGKLSIINQSYDSPEKTEILEDLARRSRVVIGRQPTLHRHSVQSFKVVLVSGDAIRLPPLTVAAFNADFDGDQMHLNLPLLEASKSEVEYLLCNTKNIFLARNGKCHMYPRQEMIYGLWLASKIEQDGNFVGKICDSSVLAQKENKGTTYGKLLLDYKENRIKITDYVIENGKNVTVGKALIRACLPNKFKTLAIGDMEFRTYDNAEDSKCSGKWCQELLGKIYRVFGETDFIRTIDNFKDLGFAVGVQYPPNISVINIPDVSAIVKKFDEKIMKRQEMYYLGFETDTGFNAYYDKQYSILKDNIQKYITEELGPDNGFRMMADSGARGDSSTLMQIFGIKGRIMKNGSESFNAIIKHSMAHGLTNFEHFITAYGGRQGQIEKSLETAKPGTLSRTLGHEESPLFIRAQDCGTEKGLVVDFDTLAQFIDMRGVNDIILNNQVRDYFVSIVVGRYLVGFDDSVDEEGEAKSLYDHNIANIGKDGKIHRIGSLTIRSAVYCESPICVKCYGRDLTKVGDVKVGEAVGSVASTSTGEVAAQTTLKSFQTGGVAGVTNLMSSFDIIKTYFQLSPLSTGEIRTSDIISPVEGWVRTIPRDKNTMSIRIMDDSMSKNLLRKEILVYKGVELKEYVTKGESIFKYQGDLEMREVIKLRGVEQAKKYLTLKLYDIFKAEAGVNIKHFEVAVAGMSFWLCLKGNKDFESCRLYSIQEYNSMNKEGAILIPTIYSINTVPHLRNDMLSGILFQNLISACSKGLLTSGYDSLSLPYNRVAMGLRPQLGTGFEGNTMLA